MNFIIDLKIKFFISINNLLFYSLNLLCYNYFIMSKFKNKFSINNINIFILIILLWLLAF